MKARSSRAHRPPPAAEEARSTRRRGWHRSPERSELLALYAEVDAVLAGWSCSCSRDVLCASQVDCCHFAVTGREPYPTAVELEEVRHAMRGLSMARPRLPLADARRCPLLSENGRCRIYASRPFGCRTFFCDHAQSPFAGLGARSKVRRDFIQPIGRRIADLSAHFAPRDPHPRALVRALSSDVD